MPSWILTVSMTDFGMMCGGLPVNKTLEVSPIVHMEIQIKKRTDAHDEIGRIRVHVRQRRRRGVVRDAVVDRWNP